MFLHDYLIKNYRNSLIDRKNYKPWRHGVHGEYLKDLGISQISFKRLCVSLCSLPTLPTGRRCGFA